MSPEVQRHEPYNEKADVYSFGVMMFEAFSRQMIVTSKYAVDPEAYAILVSDGFREAKPERMHPELFKLVDWCRSQDPNERPSMVDVVECLESLRSILKPSDEADPGCACVVS